MTLREAIAGVIEKHVVLYDDMDGRKCGCGDEDWADHDIHVSDAICSSPEVREAMERATSEWVDGDDRWLPNGRSLADAILGPVEVQE